jgi:hypothetical protein
MTKQPDKLFRDKLAHYSKPAPLDAWSKIETRLEKKRFPFLRMAVAASFLIVSISAYILWVSTKNNQDLIAENKVEVRDGSDAVEAPFQSSTAAEADPEKTESHSAPQVSADQPADETQGVRDTPIRNSSGRKIVKPIEGTYQEQRMASIADQPLIEDLPIDVPLDIERVGAETGAKAISKEEPIRIVMSIAETNEYLIKNTNSDATSEDKKSSTLKRVLKKASDLKNNQDPFGDLRQMKNELLALNFKSEKQRGQNK